MKAVYRFGIAFTLVVILILYLLFYIPQQHAQPIPTGGEYVLDTADPLYSSWVLISSSTAETLRYSISTVVRLHTGQLEGTAQRIMGTSTIAYSDTGNPGCTVTIIFPEASRLYYLTADTPLGRGTYTCSSYHGAHAYFMDGGIHVLDGKITTPTIKELGYTDADIRAMDTLFPGAISVQAFLNYELDDGESVATQLTDTQGKKGYAIQTPDMYNGARPCDFADFHGSCYYTAFLKDQSGHYWILSGSNGGEFEYRTTDMATVNTLPEAFKREMARMGLTESVVVFQ